MKTKDALTVSSRSRVVGGRSMGRVEQALQTRTCAIFPDSTRMSGSSISLRTMNSTGMYFRSGEHWPQTTFPQFLWIVSAVIEVRVYDGIFDSPTVMSPIEQVERCGAVSTGWGFSVRLPYGKRVNDISSLSMALNCI